MPKLLACIDGSVYSNSVADHAAWAAERLGASVELLQVLPRPEASSDDRSGRIGIAARRRLLEQLAELDAERAKVLHEKGWLELDEARQRIEALGVSDVRTSLRHGDLLETLAEREASADLVVVGKRGEAADFAQLHLGSNLERMLRASHRTVLVASRAFRPIERFMIAFDARSSALRAVDAVSRSALFAGLEGTIVTVGSEKGEARRRLEDAARQLRAGGLSIAERMEAGEPDTVIPKLVESEGIDLLVMGAYGHSRLRTLVIGSTTSEMIRGARVPILVWR
jgi:nucleotide-binding universal stress UspA family protein